jgi:hypothetical protein
VHQRNTSGDTQHGKEPGDTHGIDAKELGNARIIRPGRGALRSKHGCIHALGQPIELTGDIDRACHIGPLVGGH